MRSVLDGAKVFSATMATQRNALGDQVTQWLTEHPDIQVVDIAVVQSSDAQFHCLTICVFYRAKS